jgi:hypothetical protein
MYVKKYSKSEQINFLASAKFQNFTYQISDVGVTANSEGRKVVPAGTVYPANDATAIGIVFHDVDVTEGPQPGAVLVEGYVLEARLPVAPVQLAKDNMTEIKFR